MPTKLEPLQDRVIVSRAEAESKTPGGIVLPESSKEKPARGEVVAVGPGRRTEDGELIEVGVKVGESVLFSQYAGHDVELDGAELTILKEDEILGIIRS